MPGATFSHSHRVTYAECTLGNHIYYARYLDLLEAARGEFFRHVGQPLSELQTRNLIFPVIEARLKYFARARYDDQLEVKLWITRLSRLRIEFAYRVSNEPTELLVQADTAHVCSSVEERPRRMPEELVALLEGYCEAPSDSNAITAQS